MTKKNLITLFLALMAIGMSAHADTNYYKITEFPIDGVTFRDTFLIVVEYAGNTYIWDGQNATGKNYVCLENYSNTTITGNSEKNYKQNEVAIFHNQYHEYGKLFSVLSWGDGEREDKGGYYVAGVGGNNGISFSDGQRNAEIELMSDGIHIATKSGLGVFRFNITPNDPHGFKFYEHDINMLHPSLYVKGNIDRYKPITSGTTTSLNQTNLQSAICNKVIKSGHLLIEKDGKTYTVTGQEIK